MVSILVAATSTTFAKKNMPDVTHEGLERVKGDGTADYIYIHPEADFSGYKRVILDEPQISFARYWQQSANSGRTFDRITNSDIEKMISTGKKLLTEEFTKELKNGGITIAGKAEGDVLLVKAIISDLSLNAPDPKKTAGGWSRVYAESAGDATLTVELYDSITKQILIRAIDTKRDVGESFGWRRPRSHYTNVQDARQALGEWARTLTIGLQRAMAAPPKKDAN